MHPLRSFQREAIEALREPGQLLCIAPTGSGKSRVYEELAALPGRRTLLITPLVALARQQARGLEERGVPTLLTAGAGESAPRRPLPGQRAWIMSPESLASASRRAALAAWRPNLAVIDECHCLWEWGDDFRPAFGRVPGWLRALPTLERTLWLTATLPRPAREALAAAAGPGLRQLGEFRLPPTLALRALRVPWPDRLDALAAVLERRRAPGLVFAPTRELAERLARALSALGRRAASYHAGLSREERAAIEGALARGRLDALAATSAFGMGMNYARLEWVALWQPPSSLLALAQAAGRVGRGALGEAWVFWDHGDLEMLEWTIGASARRRAELEALDAFLRARGCREIELRAYFDGRGRERAGEDGGAALPCGRCDGCAAGVLPGVDRGGSSEPVQIASI